MHDVWLDLPQPGTKSPGVLERVDRANRHRELAEQVEVGDLVTRAQVGVHLDVGATEHLDLIGHNPVFTRWERGPILVVDEENPHALAPADLGPSNARPGPDLPTGRKSVLDASSARRVAALSSAG